MSAKILFVDDEPNILSAYQRGLRNQFDMDTATSGAEALKLIEEKGPYAVIISDMSMPGMDGITFLEKAKEIEPDTVRMMLTGNADLRVAMDALHRGSIFQFLVKPCTSESLALAVDGAVAQYRLVTGERELLDKTLKGTIRVLMEMLSLADPVLFGKVQHLRQAVRMLAHEIDAPDTWKLELAAMLSQIGLVTLPPQILAKMRSNLTLSEVEAKMMERIPEISHNLLINIPRLEAVAQAVLYKDKRYDGAGFPEDKVSGNLIPLGARMLKVLGDLAQLESEGVSRAGALAMMQRRPGWYDPKILEGATRCLLGKNRSTGAQRAACTPIAIRDLRIGDVIGLDIAAVDGTLLISEGHQVTATLLEKIKNFADLTGIKEPIYIVKHPTARDRMAA